jgi:hypothetical protein
VSSECLCSVIWQIVPSIRFLNNFQIVGFGDFGTAWNGLDPYARSNSLFTRIISQGPLTITIEEQKDPLVGGLGFGLRSRILGYS